MDPLNKLAELFREFPGIGPRQSKRFVYFLLTRSQGYIDELITNLTELKKSITICKECFRFYPRNNDTVCSICRDSQRNKHELMVVSRDVDFETIERSRVYQGLYFVLGGNIPILEKNPGDRVRSNELLSLVQRRPEITEIILSLNANPEGEHTAEVIKSMLGPITGPRSIKISVLGRGLSTGTELEYSDSDTIRNALRNRS